MGWTDALVRLGVLLAIVVIADMVLELATSKVSDLIVGVVIGFFVASLDKIVAIATNNNGSSKRGGTRKRNGRRN